MVNKFVTLSMKKISEIDNSCKHTWKMHFKKGWWFYSEVLWCPKCGSYKIIT